MSANSWLFMEACKCGSPSKQGGKCAECRLAAECDAEPPPKPVEDHVGEALAAAVELAY